MKKINLELELEEGQEIFIKIKGKDVVIEELTDEEKIVEWLCETFPKKYKKPTISKEHPLYNKIMRGIINNFTGEKED